MNHHCIPSVIDQCISQEEPVQEPMLTRPFCMLLSDQTYRLVTQIRIRKSGKEAMLVHLVWHEASCIPFILSNVPRRGASGSL